VDSDFILIDVRDVSEVATGIIASDCCKPYHMSWNSGELEDNYSLLPIEMAIILYCRSGNRSMQAANFLAGKDFTNLSSLDGGINSYPGELKDSSEFKEWGKLPEPSYFAEGCDEVAVSRTSRQPRFHIVLDIPQYYLTLNGKMLKSKQNKRSAPVYLLRRQGDKTTGKINGIDRSLREQ
jgi:rhodanese-related sulfurtransferase